MTIILTNNCDSNNSSDSNKKNNEVQNSTLTVDNLIPEMEGLSLKTEQNRQIPCFPDEKLISSITRKKLHLVLDLDHTLVHTIPIRDLTEGDRAYLTHKDRRNCFEKGQFNILNKEFLIKVRPYARAFLKDASTMFDFSIFTLGNKIYAKRVAEILDSKGIYFSSSNVFTREDCKIPMIKGLDVVNQDEKITLVVDDTKKVWRNYSKNLIEIKPYKFFDDKTGLKTGLRTWSWTQCRGDESEKNGELARVLEELKKIHSAFFDSKEDQVDDDYYKIRDVRVVVDEMRRK